MHALPLDCEEFRNTCRLTRASAGFSFLRLQRARDRVPGGDRLVETRGVTTHRVTQGSAHKHDNSNGSAFQPTRDPHTEWMAFERIRHAISFCVCVCFFFFQPFSFFRRIHHHNSPFPPNPKKLQLLVDFTASWCGPCKMIGPYFEELAAKFQNVVFVKVDVDDLDDIAAECGISAMPTFQLYRYVFAFPKSRHCLPIQADTFLLQSQQRRESRRADGRGQGEARGAGENRGRDVSKPYVTLCP